MTAPMLAKKIAELTLSKKGHDVAIMDLRKLTSMTDYFVVCSADSDVQVRAIADAVMEGLEKKGAVPWHKELGSANWVLLDYVDVVLHVFHKTARSFYNLEKLWGDAVIKHLKEDTKPAVAASRRTSSKTKSASVRKKAS
ncbi:MAG TPA: ribosome silencing factor [Bacteroidota bacterium]|nr:ribosome silencing factor [Bacteroidota bacterium]